VTSYIIGEMDEEQYEKLLDLDCIVARTNYKDDIFSVLVTLEIPLLDIVELAQDYEEKE